MSAEQIGTGTPDGATLGVSGGKVSLYGATPVAQQAIGSAVATTNLGTTGILAGLNALNTLTEKLKLIGIVKT